MKESTRKFIATEVVLLSTLTVVAVAILTAGLQIGLLLSPKVTLPVLYLGRWCVWALNQCRARAELRLLVRRCAHYVALSLVGAGLVVLVSEGLRAAPMSATTLFAGLVLCVLGGAVIVWTNKEFPDEAIAPAPAAQDGAHPE